MVESSSQTGCYLVALTPESSEAIRAKEINIPHLPFRVGRESRKPQWTDQGLVGERRTAAPPNNDLYLVEQSEPMNVSREHFLIDKEGGIFHLRDRGSACGTLVEGETIGGGGRPDRVALKDHDVIIIGTSLSRYIFKFRLET
jgi:pSer/pThr/pTyr-binding forkhead associated (FHA) protein